MSVRNKLAKGIFYIGVALLTAVQSYLIGLLFSGAVLAPVLAVWSLISPLPVFVVQKLWLVYILSGVPMGISVAVYTATDIAKAHSKKHNKQDNGNN